MAARERRLGNSRDPAAAHIRRGRLHACGGFPCHVPKRRPHAARLENWSCDPASHRFERRGIRPPCEPGSPPHPALRHPAPARPDHLAPDVLAKLEHHENSHVQVAIERLLWRRPEMQSVLARRNWNWTSASEQDCCYHAARVRLLQRDFEPLLRLRQGEASVIEALGPYALEILALAGDGRDSHLAAELARGWPTTPQLLDSLGRIGLPSLFPRLLAELESDDFDDDAMLALTTAVGPQQNWEQAIESLPKLPEPTRLRGGKPYSLRSVIEEMTRAEFSARDVQLRADELFFRAGKRVNVEWHGFGLSLESSLAELVKNTR